MIWRLFDSVFLHQGGWEAWRSELAALHLVALTLLVAVTLAWGRHGRRRLLLASGCITVSAVILIYLTTVRPNDIPRDWITLLHEGLEYMVIQHLYARGVHAGANFAFVVSAIAGQLTLRDVVWLNLLLAVINALIFFHVALHVTGPIWALVWTAVFALNPPTFLAAFSELPAHLLALYFLWGVIAWAVVTDPLPQPPMIRAAAYGLCAVLTVLVSLSRLEVALIGVVALIVHAARFAPDWWASAGRRLGAACQWAFVLLSDHPAAVGVLCVVGVWLSQAGLPWELAGRAECAALYPFDPSIFSFYPFLPMLLLPVSVSVAVVFGFIHAIVHFRRLGGLALSLLILIRMYLAAQNQYYEAGRYLSYILPAIFCLGLFGQRQLHEMARRWGPNWYRAARIAYVMAWFTRPPPGALEFYLRPEYREDAGFSQVLLDLNTQREARHLLALTEDNPQCVFVGRVLETRDNPKHLPKYAYAIFGAPIADPLLVPEESAPLVDVIAQHASGASCVRLYYGGDCNLTFTDRCEKFIAGRRLIDEQRFGSRPYNSMDFGYGAPEIVLATYAWP